MYELQEPSAPIIDYISFQSAEADLLEKKIPVQTEIGRLTLGESLRGGCEIVAGIVARQEAIRELREKPEIRGALRASLTKYSTYEENAGDFLAGRFPSFVEYKELRKSFQVLQTIGADEEGHTLPMEAGMLDDCARSIAAFSSTSEAGLMRGPVYYTPAGLRSKEDVGWMPRLRFRPWLSGRVTALGVAGVEAARQGWIPPELIGGAATVALMPLALSLLPGESNHTMKDMMWNNPLVYRRLHSRLKRHDGYTDALRAVGELDMLVALSDF